MVELAEKKMSETGLRLLWGTANLFSHPRYAAGASTNPDPEVFAYAAAQVKHALEATLRLGGANYVLWGGREGYDTLLNTDLRAEGEQLARFLTLVAEHKHRIGFEGTLLIEPKPAEPTKHQYDYDTQTVHGFLQRFDLADEYRVNIEANHATLAGHSFHHEVAYAVSTGSSGRSMPTAETPRTGGTPTSSPTRSKSGPLFSTRSSAEAGSPPEGSTSTPSSAANRSTEMTCSTATSAPSTPLPPPCSSPPTWSSPRRSPRRWQRGTPAGLVRWDRPSTTAPRASNRWRLG